MQQVHTGESSANDKHVEILFAHVILFPDVQTHAMPTLLSRQYPLERYSVSSDSDLASEQRATLWKLEPDDESTPTEHPPMPDVVGFRAKMATLIPSTNTLVESDFWRMAIPGGTFHAGRMYIPEPTVRPMHRVRRLIATCANRLL